MKLALALLAASALSISLFVVYGKGPESVLVEPEVAALDGAGQGLRVADPPEIVPSRAPSPGALEGLPSAVEARISASVDEEAAPQAAEGPPTKVTVNVVRSLRRFTLHNPPIAGVEVALTMKDAPGDVLRTGVTNKNGSVTLNVSDRLLIPDERGFTQMRATVKSLGFWPGIGFVRVKEENGKLSVSSRIATHEGWVQKVTVEEELPSSIRTPVTVRSLRSKSIRFSHSDGSNDIGREPELKVDFKSEVTKDANGDYALYLRASEAERWIIVDGGRKGRAAHLLGEPTGAGAQPEPIHLSLRGDAKLKGKVVDGRGEPAPGVRLVATWIPEIVRGPIDATMEPLRAELMKRGEGQFLQDAKTDATGRYWFEGLLPGNYRIDALRSSEDSWEPEQVTLGGQVASAEPSDATLTYTRPIIIVTVETGSDSETCDLVLYDAGPVGSTPWVKPESNYGGSLPTEDPIAMAHPPGTRSANYDGETAVFEIQEGRQYLLVARGNGYDPTPQLLAVPLGAPPVAADVTFQGEAFSGTLKIDLTLGKLRKLETGEKEGWLGTDGTYGVIIEDVETGLHLGSFESKFRRKEMPEFQVPAGRVRVVAVGLPEHDLHHGTVMGPRRYGRVQKIVEIQPGEVTTAALELTENGGYLEVSLKGRINATDEAQKAERLARLQESGSFFEEEGLLSGSLSIEDQAQRIFLPVARTALAWMNSSAGGWHTVNSWPMGETHKSSVLPPGSYTLRAHFPGRPPIEVGVTITTGETTPVELDFGG